MAKKVHPDKSFDPSATETFQALLKAKNVLMDSTMRKDFDQKLRCCYGESSWNRWGNSKRSGRSNGGSNGGLDAGRNGGRFSSFKPQWAFIVLIIFVLIMAYLFYIPSYSLISSEKFPLKCTTTNIKVPYYLAQNRDCFTKYKPLGNLWEIMVENKFWNTMRDACNAEMHYRDASLEYARKMQMPSCDKLDFFTNGY
ncbi:uncharacterized protein [Drosophila pseudoobscura]|uniref:J domain-containing protein n=1 Tax=Drosophila pseudoobscura pseudoobscura TaxID=46245 RepID=A0A6I8UZ01_DROPS|nr:uncharacterized protein LOC6901155 [Drosophila pseudoobscura]